MPTWLAVLVRIGEMWRRGWIRRCEWRKFRGSGWLRVRQWPGAPHDDRVWAQKAELTNNRKEL